MMKDCKLVEAIRHDNAKKNSTSSQFCPLHVAKLEHWKQRITFAAETNAACSRGSADRDKHTARQRDADRHNIFSAR